MKIALLLILAAATTVICGLLAFEHGGLDCGGGCGWLAATYVALICTVLLALAAAVAQAPGRSVRE